MESDNKKKKIIIDPKDEFIKYMKKTIKNKGIKKRDVFYFADVPVSYGYKVLLGEKKTKQRDVIIRICYAANLTSKELQEALKLYEMPVLYKKFMRDKIILEWFDKRNKDIYEFNEYLIKNKLEPLRKCGESKP